MEKIPAPISVQWHTFQIIVFNASSVSFGQTGSASNKDLLTSCNLEPLSVVVRKRRWRWLGHVLRMETDSLPRAALRWTPQGIERRRRGRPKVTWRRTMVCELKECGLTLKTARRQSEDRQQWRTLAEAPCATKCVSLSYK